MTHFNIEAFKTTPLRYGQEKPMNDKPINTTNEVTGLKTPLNELELFQDLRAIVGMDHITELINFLVTVTDADAEQMDACVERFKHQHKLHLKECAPGANCYTNELGVTLHTNLCKYGKNALFSNIHARTFY